MAVQLEPNSSEIFFAQLILQIFCITNVTNINGNISKK